jgi:hypothetical protein
MDKECLSQRGEQKMSTEDATNHQNNQTENAKKTEPQSTCIFSPEEIRTTVKNFTLGWLSGAVKIHFRIAHEIMEEAKFTKEKMDWNQALQEERVAKQEFLKLVDICVGAVKATPEQQEQALAELFRVILILRAGARIEGSFVSSINIEEKLGKIEEDLQATKDLVFELSIAVRQWKPKE